jgi:CRP/FNR family transcriptional regulator
VILRIHIKSENSIEQGLFEGYARIRFMFSIQYKSPSGNAGPIRAIATPGAFKGLSPQCAGRLLASAVTINLPERKTLIEAGAAPDGCYWLEDGLMKGIIATHLGDERIVELLGPGSTIGAISLMDGLPQSVTVQAITGCRLIFVPRRVFFDCMQDFPEMITYAAIAIAAHFRRAGDKAAADSFFPARARVARALLQFAQHFGDSTAPPHLLIIKRRFRKSDVAALAHVARENASRILGSWIRMNVISAPSPTVWVMHRGTIEREAQIIH